MSTLGHGGRGQNGRDPPRLPLGADLTSRLARPSRAQASRGSCWEREGIELVAWLVNPASSLTFFVKRRL